VCSGEALGLQQEDRILPVVPMFHGNAWGLPYAGWLVGADLLLPSRFMAARQIVELIVGERATLAGAVPTVWHDVLGLGADHGDLSSLRMVMCGGAAVPRTLIQAYAERYGVRMVQGWGMTETSPVASLAFAPKSVAPERGLDYRATAGRPLGGVQARIVDDEGTVLPRDGAAVGELEVRGPWVTTSYYRDPAPERFHDGWLRTGDVGSIDAHGFITIRDRAKDVIKSGGEWIASLDLEAAMVAHPAVREAAVIAASDDRWGERPLACVVLEDSARVTADELRAFLGGRVAKWWIPERWTFVDEIPRTSVGKYDKKALRASNAEGDLDVILSEAAAGSASTAMTRE
jgi:fatty-acyl-CoA synthase